MSAPRVTTFRDGEAWVARVAVGGCRIEATHTTEANALATLGNLLTTAAEATAEAYLDAARRFAFATIHTITNGKP